MRTRDLFSSTARLVLPLLAATAVLSGQSGTGAPPGLPPRQPKPQTPVFTATTNFVSTNVIVRDAKGRFVPGLTASDFVVYEDGVRQTINLFHPFIGGRDMAAAARPASRTTGGLIVPRQAPASDTSGRIFIVFIDDLSFQSKATSMVQHIMGMLKQVITEEDRVGIVSSGYSSIAVDLMHDYGYKHLEEAINHTMGSGMSSHEIITAASTAEGPAGLQYMAHTAMKTANDILDKLGQVTDARKGILYISEGYDFDPYQDSRLKAEQERFGKAPGTSSSDPANTGAGSSDDAALQNPFLKTGQQFAFGDLVRDLAELIRNANRANVSFYPIDPRGLDAGPDINETVSMKEHQDHYHTSVNALKAMADSTGGYCVCGSNDFKGGLERINNEMSDYYLVGYNSSNPNARKVRRLIRIEVIKKPGVTLTYRTEYTFKRAGAKGKV